LTRLNSMISSFAGHNRFYRGVISININEWIDHTGEDHFTKFLNFIASNNDKWLVVFNISTENKKSIENVETTLSSYLRIETLRLRFPEKAELVELMESQYMQDKEISFIECAKILVSEAIDEISAGKQFNGFKSIIQLTNDILFHIYSTNEGNKKNISAEMISCFSKDSCYIKRAKSCIETNKTIGFLNERSI